MFVAVQGNRGILLEVSIFYVFSNIADVAPAHQGKRSGSDNC